MTNEILRAMEDRRSCKSYESTPVKEEDLDAVLRAGLYAANGRGQQAPVMVVLQKEEDVRALSALNARIMGAKGDPFYGAPAVIVVLVDPAASTGVEDGSLVIGNLMLAASSLGLGSCWIHRAKEEFEREEGKALLKKWGLPENMRGVGHCIVGYPKSGAYDKPRAPRKEGRVIKAD